MQFFIPFSSIISVKNNWAVLVAGSNGYSNYRHQSDIFHHYHILVDRGIKPENIIIAENGDVIKLKNGIVYGNTNK